MDNISGTAPVAAAGGVIAVVAIGSGSIPAAGRVAFKLAVPLLVDARAPHRIVYSYGCIKYGDHTDTAI
jgi:hypothetical protein